MGLINPLKQVLIGIHYVILLRRVIGLLRIATRMVSRDKYAADILGLLGSLFISADASAAMSLVHKTSRLPGGSLQPAAAAENELVHTLASQVRD